MNWKFVFVCYEFWCWFLLKAVISSGIIGIASHLIISKRDFIVSFTQYSAYVTKNTHFIVIYMILYNHLCYELLTLSTPIAASLAVSFLAVSKSWISLARNFKFVSILCTHLQETCVKNNFKAFANFAAFSRDLDRLKKYFVSFLFSHVFCAIVIIFIRRESMLQKFYIFQTENLETDLGMSKCNGKTKRLWNTDKPLSTVYGSFVFSNIASDCHSACAGRLDEFMTFKFQGLSSQNYNYHNWGCLWITSTVSLSLP